MANRFEQFPNNDNSKNENPEETKESVNEASDKNDFKKSRQTSGPKEAGEKDKKELEEFITKTQSEILLRMLNGGKGGLGFEDIERHDKEFAPEKMAEIEKDAQKWVGDMPANLAKIAQDLDAYKNYVDFLEERGREKEAMSEKDYFSILEKLQKAFERKDPEVERMIREHYEASRIKSLIGVPSEKEREKGEPVDDPYLEIKKRLVLAQEQLKKEGLSEDAENLAKTIARVQKEIASGKEPSQILLWDKEVDKYPKGEPTLFDKIDKAMLKIPLIGKYMARNYRESVRDAGGTIIRADGSKEKFYTFTHFKKPGEKKYIPNAPFSGYHEVAEPQQGDEVVSWEPSEQGKQIIMEALGGSVSSLPGATSMGQSEIEYRTDEFSTTNNVEYDVKKRADERLGVIYSNARLIITSKPYKKELK